MNRTFLVWQEADISKVGGQSGPHTLTASGKDAILRDKNRRLLKGTRCRYMTV